MNLFDYNYLVKKLEMTEEEDPAFISKIFEIEREEWARLSVSLRQHGLPAVDVILPARVSRFSDVVILSADMAKCLRQSLVMLMRDGDRRQELVQEMIITNNQLREELKAQTLITLRHEDEVTRLKAQLAELSSRLQRSVDESQLDVSSSRLLDSTVSSRLCVTQLQAKCDQLRQKCDLYEQEVERLSMKNKRFIDELKDLGESQLKVKQLERMVKSLKSNRYQEEKRRQRENEVFEHLRRKQGKEHIDEIVVNIIDSYERQIHLLRKELNGDADGSMLSEAIQPGDKSTPNFKALIRTYEKSLMESKRKLKAVEDECETVKLELQSRPQLKDLRESQLKVKQLERMVKSLKSNRSLEVTNDQESRSLISDIDFMSTSRCRHFLKMFCNEVGVVDLELVIPRIQHLTQSADALPQLEQFAKEILHIVNRSDLPRPLELHDKTSHHNSSHEIWCEKTWSHAIPTLEFWAIQLKNLKELQLSIKRLIDRLFPWCRATADDGAVTTTHLIHMIDSLLYDSELSFSEVTGLEASNDTETRAMLHGIVAHFQKLFDVPNVMGVYARMSDIYRKLGETHNMMLTLKNFLGLDKSAKLSAVVNAVAQLCDAQNADTERQLTRMLDVDDISGAISKVRDYQEFFLVFRSTMEQLLSILGVQSIDEVIPRVRSLAMAG